MPRVKRGVIARARHKKVLNAAKGYRGRRKHGTCRLYVFHLKPRHG